MKTGKIALYYYGSTNRKTLKVERVIQAKVFKSVTRQKIINAWLEGME